MFNMDYSHKIPFDPSISDRQEVGVGYAHSFTGSALADRRYYSDLFFRTLLRSISRYFREAPTSDSFSIAACRRYSLLYDLWRLHREYDLKEVTVGMMIFQPNTVPGLKTPTFTGATFRDYAHARRPSGSSGIAATREVHIPVSYYLQAVLTLFSPQIKTPFNYEKENNC